MDSKRTIISKNKKKKRLNNLKIEATESDLNLLKTNERREVGGRNRCGVCWLCVVPSVCRRGTSPVLCLVLSQRFLCTERGQKEEASDDDDDDKGKLQTAKAER